MADRLTLAALADRLEALERAHQQAAQQAVRFGPDGQPVRMQENLHHPRPGTWQGDSQDALCRYCDLPIHRDERGRWFQSRDHICHARVAGAPAKD